MQKYFESFFTFFKDNILGVISFFVAILLFIYLVDRIAYTFRLGKYSMRFEINSNQSQNNGNIMYVFGALLLKIITDFRHFLALLLILVFGGALIYAIYISNIAPVGNNENKIDNLSKALQAVMSTLGGLVGSIVGYYFGESKVKRIKRQKMIMIQ